MKNTRKPKRNSEETEMLNYKINRTQTTKNTMNKYKTKQKKKTNLNKMTRLTKIKRS